MDLIFNEFQTIILLLIIIKLSEHCSGQQVVDHFLNTGNYKPFQSVYRK